MKQNALGRYLTDDQVGARPKKSMAPRRRGKVRETPRTTVPVQDQETTRLARGQRNLRLPSRKAGAWIGTYRRQHRTGPQSPLPPLPGSGQVEAMARALHSTRQAGGATPGPYRSFFVRL